MLAFCTRLEPPVLPLGRSAVDLPRDLTSLPCRPQDLPAEAKKLSEDGYGLSEMQLTATFRKNGKVSTLILYELWHSSGYQHNKRLFWLFGQLACY